VKKQGVSTSAQKRPAAETESVGVRKRPAKRAAGLSSVLPLDNLPHLPDDALRQLLARVPSEAFASLAATCTRVKAELRGEHFTYQRARSGWLETRVCLCVADDLSDDFDADERSNSDIDDIGREGCLPCTRVLRAKIFVDGQAAGTLDATLVDRNELEEDGEFFEACDAESQELINIGKVLFDGDGHARLKVLDEEGGPEAAEGGFLYIDKLVLCEPFLALASRTTEFSTQAVRKFLQLEELGNRWTVAAYIGEGSTAELLEMDCRTFLRLKFREVDKAVSLQGGWFYTTRMWFSEKHLTHEESLSVTLHASMQSTPEREMSPLDQGLFEMVKCLKSDVEVLPWAMEALLQSGASLDDSDALHCAVHHGRPLLARALIRRGARVNSLDRVGTPALVVAAQGYARGRDVSFRARDACFQCIETLLEHGADKGSKDTFGRTAYVAYQAEVADLEDFEVTFGLPRRVPDANPERTASKDAAVLRLLRPPM